MQGIVGDNTEQMVIRFFNLVYIDELLIFKNMNWKYIMSLL